MTQTELEAHIGRAAINGFNLDQFHQHLDAIRVELQATTDA